MQTGVKPMTGVPEPFPLADDALPKRAWEYLDRIRALCEEKKIELILVKAPTNSCSYWGYDELESQISDYAETHGLSYYNFISCQEEIGLDWSTDTYDEGVHLNVSGAEKLTDYFGKLLSEQHRLPDHRTEAETAALWAEKLERYRTEQKGDQP